MSIIHVGITGIGHELGEIGVSNEEVSKIVETALRDKNEHRTGNRNLSKEEEQNGLCDPRWLNKKKFYGRVHSERTPVGLGVPAARKAIDMAGCNVQDIQAVFFGTVHPDYNISPTCAQLAI